MLVDTGVVHHTPADVGVHSALLVASVYKLQAQLKVVSHSDFQFGQDQVYVSHRKVRLVSFAAKLLCLFQDGLLLSTTWIAQVKLISVLAKSVFFPSSVTALSHSLCRHWTFSLLDRNLFSVPQSFYPCSHTEIWVGWKH